MKKVDDMNRRKFLNLSGKVALGATLFGLGNNFLNRCERDDNSMPVIDYFKNPE
jgi:hypothetical protein